MSYLTYKVLHLLGALFATAALAGYALTLFDRGSRAGDAVEPRTRKLVGAFHGLALVLVLVSGFGLLAKLQLGFPIWVWIKLSIWLIIGASLVLIRKFPQKAILWWFAVPAFTFLAASLGVLKPF